VAIALIASGLNYTLPGLARRLARDGEGELIGWDLEDNDREPFDTGGGKGGADDTAVAGFLLGGEGIRLVPVRLHPSDPTSHAQGVAFAARTPARVALLLLTSTPPPEAWVALRQAAVRFHGILLILPAADAGPASSAVLTLGNVLAVEHGGESAEAVGFGGSTQRLAGPALAVAAAGRAAAAVLAREPRLDAAGLKRRLVDAGGGALWHARQ
jgi:hypothetical protein